MYYVHKFAIELVYGGPEEGGWWYTAGTPVESDLFHSDNEESALNVCRALNDGEKERQEEEEEYSFHSVLAHRSTHYTYRVEEEAVARLFPEVDPTYC